MKTTLAFLIVVLGLTTSASAIVRDWTNSNSDNDFGEVLNWDPFGVDFASGDDYYIDLGGVDKAVLSAAHPTTIDDIYVGTVAGDAELEITGGTHLVGNRFRHGRGGSNTVIDISGGTVNVPNSYTTWGDDGAIAVTMTGGEVNVDRITLGQKGFFHSSFDFSGGELNIAPSDASPSSISGGFRFGGEDDGLGNITTQAVTISGTAVFTAESLFLGNTEGSTDPLNPAGVFTINGGEVHLTGSTLFAFSGGLQDDLPILAFEGTEDLPTVPAGTILPTFLGGIVEMEGGVWTLAGDHVSFINDAIADGYITHSGATTHLEPIYDGGSDITTVTIVSNTPSGDVNGDGWVDGLDYLEWAGNFGTHPGPDGDVSDGDLNDDGWIDGLDYLLWAGDFGTHAASAVPEPGTFALTGLALMGVLFVRRRS